MSDGLTEDGLVKAVAVPVPVAAGRRLKLPVMCNSATLARHARAVAEAEGRGAEAVDAEVTVLFVLLGTGTTADYQFGDREGRRTFVLKWEARLEGHVLRVPMSLWCAEGHKLAFELMDQRRTVHACVVMLEPPSTEAVERAHGRGRERERESGPGTKKPKEKRVRRA